MQQKLSSPLPRGKGFFVSGRLVLATAVLAAFGLASMPAHAVSVTVTLDVYRGYGPASTSVAHCAVSVEQGSGGVAVLSAAQQTGCIQSYAVTTQYGFGNYLECVNADCEIPRGNAAHGTVVYWRETIGGTISCQGLDGFNASAGKQLGLWHAPTATLAVDITGDCAN